MSHLPSWPPFTDWSGNPPPDAASYGGLWPPVAVELDGDWLRFSLPKLPPAEPVWPDRSALVELVGIADGGCKPTRLRRFAAKWGPLGGHQTRGCEHEPPPAFENLGGVTRTARECLTCWRELAEQCAALMRLAGTAKTDSAAALDLQHQLTALVLQQGIGPLPLFNPPRVVFSTTAGLPGYLTIALLGLWAALDGRGLPELCAGCGAIFEGLEVYERKGAEVRRRPRRDRLHYCPKCRSAGLATRDAVRRYRARRRAGVESHQQDRIRVLVSELEAAAATVRDGEA